MQQGSILGPTLFLLYINDAECCISPDTRLAVHSDDTTVYSMIQAITDINTSTESLQQSVQALEEWGERWRITFEPTKSQCMRVSTQRAQWPIPHQTIDGNILQNSDSIKLLGVTFDTHLSYRNHLRAVALRANQRIGFFRKASHVLNRQGSMATYKGFIRPLQEFAPLVWIGTAQSHLQALDCIQRKAMKFIGVQTLLPTLATRRLVSALTYLYKLQCISGPAQFTAQFTSMVPPPALPTPHQRTRAQHEIATSINFPVRYR